MRKQETPSNTRPPNAKAHCKQENWKWWMSNRSNGWKNRERNVRCRSNLILRVTLGHLDGNNDSGHVGEEGRQPDHALVVDGQTITLPSYSPAATPRRPWSRASTCWSSARGRPSRCWPRPGHLGWWQGCQTCVVCGGYYWSWASAVGWDADVVVTCTASDVWVDEKAPDGRGLEFDLEDHKLLFKSTAWSPPPPGWWPTSRPEASPCRPPSPCASSAAWSRWEGTRR